MFQHLSRGLLLTAPPSQHLPCVLRWLMHWVSAPARGFSDDCYTLSQHQTRVLLWLLHSQPMSLDFSRLLHAVPRVLLRLLHSFSPCPWISVDCCTLFQGFCYDCCTLSQHLSWGLSRLLHGVSMVLLWLLHSFSPCPWISVDCCTLFQGFLLWLLHPLSAPLLGFESTAARCFNGFDMTAAPSLSTSPGVWVVCCTVFQGFSCDCCTLSQHLSWGLSRLLHGISRVLLWLLHPLSAPAPAPL